MKRRAFFKSLASAIAVIALAPEIAFNFQIKEAWGRFGPGAHGVYEQLQYCMPAPLQPLPLDIEDFLNAAFAIKRQRGEQSHIDIIVHEDSLPLLKKML